MSVMSGLIAFIVIWTVVIFMVLPMGVKMPEVVEKGHASSAPENPQIWKKVWISALVSAVVWAGFYLFMISEYARLD